MNPTATRHAWQATITALLATLFLLTGTTTPAQAAETAWGNWGDNARANSAAQSVIIAGASYDITRGTDNNIWFRYNGGAWRPLGGDLSSRTTSPPRILEWPRGRAIVFVRGMDGEIWYTQVNSGSANFWTSWARLPGGSQSIGAPLVGHSPSGLGTLFVEAPNANRRISYMLLQNTNGAPDPVGGWSVTPYALLSSDANDLNGDGQIAVYGTERFERVLRSFWTGADNHVYSVTRTANGTVTNISEVNGGGVCRSGLSAARLGNQTTVLTPGQAGYENQQRVMIACRGNDGTVWETTSSDGGRTFDGWRRPIGTPAPTHSAPSIIPTATSWTLTLRWNATASSAWPDNSIIAKRIN